MLTCKREREELVKINLVQVSSQGLEERVSLYFARAKSVRAWGDESAGLS